MALVRFALNDGTELDVNPGAPWTAREQVAWEEHFKASFVTVYKALEKEQASYRAAQAEAYQKAVASGQVDIDEDSLAVEVDAVEFKVTWMLWFGWFRLRPKVASRFSTFVDEQLVDWNFVPDESPDEQAAEPAGEDGSLDPTPASSPPGRLRKR